MRCEQAINVKWIVFRLGIPDYKLLDIEFDISTIRPIPIP